MKNNLPKYWIIKNDGSQLFQDTVIRYLNTKYETKWSGHVLVYYWFDWNQYKNWTNLWHNISQFENNPTLLTINEFIEMTTEEFTKWELVEVRDCSTSNWQIKIFITEIKGSNYPFVCVNDYHNEEFKTNKKFNCGYWKFCRKIETKKERTVMMTDEEYNLFNNKK